MTIEGKQNNINDSTPTTGLFVVRVVISISISIGVGPGND